MRGKHLVAGSFLLALGLIYFVWVCPYVNAIGALDEELGWADEGLRRQYRNVLLASAVFSGALIAAGAALCLFGVIARGRMPA